MTTITDTRADIHIGANVTITTREHALARYARADFEALVRTLKPAASYRAGSDTVLLINLPADGDNDTSWIVKTTTATGTSIRAFTGPDSAVDVFKGLVANLVTPF